MLDHCQQKANMMSTTKPYLPLTPPEEPSKKLEISPHESRRTTPEPLDAFHGLVNDINRILGPCNGIDSKDVNVEDLIAAMASYSSNEEEWKKYAFVDLSRAYTRNLVDHGNGKANLLVVVWTPGKSSPIHDHANAHCVMKIFKGSLKETIYDWPCQRSDNPSDCTNASELRSPSTEHTCSTKPEDLQPAALRVMRETTHDRNGVTYMSDQLGLHRVGNASDDEVAVSLHLYTVSGR